MPKNTKSDFFTGAIKDVFVGTKKKKHKPKKRKKRSYTRLAKKVFGSRII